MLPVWGEVIEGLLEMACVWDTTYRQGTQRALGVVTSLAHLELQGPPEERCWDFVMLFFHNYIELRDHPQSVNALWEAVDSLGTHSVENSEAVARALDDELCSGVIRGFLGEALPRKRKRL